MKKLFYRWLVILCFVPFGITNLFASSSNDSLMNNLMKMIEKKGDYVKEKELFLSETKKKIRDSSANMALQYALQKELYQSYAPFNSDSAIYYAKRNIGLAIRYKKDDWISESLLNLASFYLIAGMYLDSENMLKSIRKEILPKHLLIQYLDIKKKFYKFYSFQNYNNEFYLELSNTYRDSLLNNLDRSSNHYKMVYAEKLIDHNKREEAKGIIYSLLVKSEEYSHEKAMLAYSLAQIYKKDGNLKMEQELLILSATCDIRNAIMENASMQALASLLYQIGHIDEAYTCIRSSMEDAIFCNAKFRTYEISQIFPIIDMAYQEHQKNRKRMLASFLIVTSILTIFLLIAVIFVYRQMKKVSKIKAELFNINIELNKLNEKLVGANDSLVHKNVELSNLNDKLTEANKIKEVYIGHFLDLCAMYIDKLEKFQTSIKKMIMGDKIDELLKLVKSHAMIDREVNELYGTFDHIFLHLFPNYIAEFNSLLREDSQIEIKANELLNTELRIFALVRLGINDSAKIANFLHYSLNTIYTYRAKVKSKAIVSKDDFDKLVMQIGSIKGR